VRKELSHGLLEANWLPEISVPVSGIELAAVELVGIHCGIEWDARRAGFKRYEETQELFVEHIHLCAMGRDVGSHFASEGMRSIELAEEGINGFRIPGYHGRTRAVDGCDGQALSPALHAFADVVVRQLHGDRSPLTGEPRKHTAAQRHNLGGILERQ